MYASVLRTVKFSTEGSLNTFNDLKKASLSFSAPLHTVHRCSISNRDVVIYNKNIDFVFFLFWAKNS